MSSPQPPDETWVCKDGRRLLVGEMEESHVRNALRMVIRRRRKLIEKFNTRQRLLAELRRIAEESDDWPWGDT